MPVVASHLTLHVCVCVAEAASVPVDCAHWQTRIAGGVTRTVTRRRPVTVRGSQSDSEVRGTVHGGVASDPNPTGIESFMTRDLPWPRRAFSRGAPAARSER